MENTAIVGRYMRIAQSKPAYERGEEASLVASAHRGEPGAIDLLLRRHIGLVVRFAMEFRGRGVPVEDLIHEACVGLLRAVRRFDPHNGARFMTYASFWVRKAILDTLADQPRSIRVPRYQRERRRPLPREVRLDDPARPGETRTIGDKLADERAPHPGNALIGRETLVRLRRHLGSLSVREQAVLASRFGLHGGPAMTLLEVGAHLGVSRERVRQIERAALTRLHRALR